MKYTHKCDEKLSRSVKLVRIEILNNRDSGVDEEKHSYPDHMPHPLRVREIRQNNAHEHQQKQATEPGP